MFSIENLCQVSSQAVVFNGRRHEWTRADYKRDSDQASSSSFILLVKPCVYYLHYTEFISTYV